MKIDLTIGAVLRDKQSHLTRRETRLYGLFQLNAEGKWERLLPGVAYRKTEAVKHFQSVLLDGAMGMRAKTCLKPIADYGFGCHE